jgi:hypothetical protein
MSRLRWHSLYRSAKWRGVHFSRAGLQSDFVAADTFATMRTLGFRTHALLALAAAVGVIAALGRPWYADTPKPLEDDLETIGKLHGPVNGLTAGIERWFTETAGTVGWDALGSVGIAIAAMAGLTAVGALACLVPPLQGVAREALRYGALACCGLVVWRLIDTPGPNAALEPRYGAFVAAAAALIALTSASAVASAPLRARRRPQATYVAPAAPPRYEAAASAGPPPGV